MGVSWMNDEGTKDNKRMIAYWAISHHLIPQNRRGSEFTGSRCDYTDGQHM